MLCYTCGYFRIHHLEVTDRQFCAVTGETMGALPEECPFHAYVGTSPYMPEARETWDCDSTADPVFNFDIFSCQQNASDADSTPNNLKNQEI